MSKGIWRKGLGLMAAAALAVTFWAPASAEPPLQSVDAILSEIPEAIVDEAVPLTFDSEAGDLWNDDRTVSIGENPDGLLSVEMAEKDLRISLPVAHSGMQDSRGSSEPTSWEDGDGVTFTPLVTPEGDVQINTIIPDADAPQRYAYDLSIPDYASVEEQGGAHLFLDADGNMIAGLAPAWAVDATGQSIPTHFEIEGKTVTQVVEFTEGTQFPVVADPFLGKNLFKSIGTKYGKYYGVYTNVVTLNLSTWGWAVYTGAGAGVGGLAAGQAILNINGWNEALAKGGKVKTQLLSKKSMRQQFSCHALGAIAAGTWELETFRVNRTSHWTYASGIHRCNWKTANKA
ncbi:hypothetical protein [Brachybacterium sp. AOP3-A1-3]|uniref:hypothetical protein n=1 Tax=Brachybacterium sp. AOP3-A1-3 TaxID=3457699 RepID=UPI004033E5ED